MKYLIGLLMVFVGITMVSFTLAQVKHGAGVASDALMSDHDKIEKLRLQVAELQDKLEALTQKYNAHTHRLHLGIANFPNQIACDAEATAAGPLGATFGHIKKVCRQVGDGNVSVMFAGSMQSQPLVTAPPGP